MKKSNTRLAEIFNTDLKQVQCIGEDGDMAVNCKTKLGAFRKFRAYANENYCDLDAYEDMTIDRVDIGSLHLNDKKHDEYYGKDSEWYVSYTERGEFEVWVYQF